MMKIKLNWKNEPNQVINPHTGIKNIFVVGNNQSREQTGGEVREVR
jgi:hypothetical protein